MARAILIKACGECPAFRWSYGSLGECCRIRRDVSAAEIDKRCPLPDMPEPETQKAVE